jgi:SAM-dependent methyltransferase
MTNKAAIYAAAARVVEERSGWHERIRTDPAYQALGGKIYPYDTIGANINPLFRLIEESGFIADFENGDVKYIADIGCANGDLSCALGLAGYNVTAVDYSVGHDQAPFVVSRLANNVDLPICVVDMSVDRDFNVDDLRAALIANPRNSFPECKFDLVICFGLLYHLKNPLAFLASLSAIGKNVVLGTHLITHLPDLRVRISADPVAYLVDAGELNSDPTNYWMFTEQAFHRAVGRSGFDIISSFVLANNQHNLGLPDRPDIGVRGFVFLRSRGPVGLSATN